MIDGDGTIYSVKKAIPLMIHLPMMMTSDSPLGTLSDIHYMQQLLPQHFERDVVNDTLAYNEGRSHSSLLCQ